MNTTIVRDALIVFVQQTTVKEYRQVLRERLQNAAHEDKAEIMALIAETDELAGEQRVIATPVDYQTRLVGQLLPKGAFIVGWLDEDGFRQVSTWGPEVSQQWLDEQARELANWCQALA